MALTDEQFREEFKPLRIPATFSSEDELDHKILYALGQLGEATLGQVYAKIVALQPGIVNEALFENIEKYLKEQFNKGLVNGVKKEGLLVFNLNKIIHANEGSVDPDLLAPGVD